MNDQSQANGGRHEGHSSYDGALGQNGCTADPVSRAARWQGLGPELCLEWLQRLVSDLIKVAMLGDGAPGLVNADLASRLQALVEGLNLKQLYGFADAVSQARELLKSPLDGLLLLEDILIRWRRVTQ